MQQSADHVRIIVYVAWASVWRLQPKIILGWSYTMQSSNPLNPVSMSRAARLGSFLREDNQLDPHEGLKRWRSLAINVVMRYIQYCS